MIKAKKRKKQETGNRQKAQESRTNHKKHITSRANDVESRVGRIVISYVMSTG
jgi:hypothetical protein